MYIYIYITKCITYRVIVISDEITKSPKVNFNKKFYLDAIAFRKIVSVS